MKKKKKKTTKRCYLCKEKCYFSKGYEYLEYSCMKRYFILKRKYEHHH